jgi:hypothetical protein
MFFYSITIATTPYRQPTATGTPGTPIGSVRFFGTAVAGIDNIAPYQSTPLRTHGTYSITAIPYNQPGASGIPGSGFSSNLVLVNQTPPPQICYGSLLSGSFNTYSSPSLNSLLVATVNTSNVLTSGIEMVGVHPNSDGELWYFLGAYRPSLSNHWTPVTDSPIVLNNTPACTNLPLLTSLGNPTATPSPTSNYADACLFIMNNSIVGYTDQEVQDRTNGQTITGTSIGANVPILLSLRYINLQYALIQYNDMNGQLQPERWIKTSDAGINNASTCLTSQIVSMPETNLLECTGTNFVNCLPANPVQSPAIFNGESAVVTAPFGDPILGCSNADSGCWVDRDNFVGPPCPYLSHATEASPTTFNSPNNCGIDLATVADNIPGQIGPKQVYSYASGIVDSYNLGSGTLRIRSIVLPEIRYNYTHLVARTDLINYLDEYVARGIILGAYGPIGVYGGTENLEHIDTVEVNDLFETYSEPPWGS